MKDWVYWVVKISFILTIIFGIAWLCIVIFSPVAQTEGIGVAFNKSLDINIFAIVAIILSIIGLFRIVPKLK